jgi:hypothetical protein
MIFLIRNSDKIFDSSSDGSNGVGWHSFFKNAICASDKLVDLISPPLCLTNHAKKPMM